VAIECHEGNRDDGQRCSQPQLISDHEISGHQGRDHGAADIDGEHGAGPLHYRRHDVAHAEEIDDFIGADMRLGQHRDRNIEIAADQRTEQQQQCGAGPDPEPHVGVAENPKLDQNDQPRQQHHQDRKQSRRHRQIMNLGIHGRASSVSMDAGGNISRDDGDLNSHQVCH
jgi:hypothetical protein